MARHRVLVVGSTGFVGSRVTSLLAGASRGAGAPTLRLLVHRRSAPSHLADRPAVETVHADLTDPSSLHGLCDGVDTLLHLASYIGKDPEKCYAINDAGTRALLAEANHAGVRRIVRLGTTAVYRDGAHRCAAEGELALGPASVTSESRLAGEQQVLAAAGIVVRPHLVFGPGDRWVVPALARLLIAVPHWVDGARALLSLIHVDDLARCLVALGRHPSPPQGSVLHAAHPVPVTARTLLSTVAHALELPQPRGEISFDEALRLPGGVRGDASAQRRLAGLSVDHWYQSERLWQLVQLSPGPDFMQRFPECVPWYRGYLSPTG